MKRIFLFLIIVFFWFFCPAQAVPDSLTVPGDTLTVAATPKISAIDRILQENKYLQTGYVPVAYRVSPERHADDSNLFYLFLIVAFVFAVMLRIYKKYFPNLFRVFFNTSLKQSQLTDQLQQEEVPSLFANTIFLISSGVFAYLALVHQPGTVHELDYIQLLFFVLAVLVIYVGKYFVLKFTGWVTGFKAQANLYIFIVFLVNKLMGIFLLPVIIVIAFAQPVLAKAFISTGLVLILLLLIARFIRSFNLLQPQIKVSKFHFLLYVLALEILPLVVLYKALGLVLGKYV